MLVVGAGGGFPRRVEGELEIEGEEFVQAGRIVVNFSAFKASVLVVVRAGGGFCGGLVWRSVGSWGGLVGVVKELGKVRSLCKQESGLC